MNREQLEKLLPPIFRRTCAQGSPLAAILEVMAGLLDPVYAVLDQSEIYFSAQHAPLGFVPFLAGWVDLEVLQEAVFEGRALPASQFPTGAGRLRDLTEQAAHLSRWRGTGKGLQQFLEVATGVKGFEFREQIPDANGKPIPFHFELTAPASLQPYTALVKAVVELEKPAYVTYELKFG